MLCLCAHDQEPVSIARSWASLPAERSIFPEGIACVREGAACHKIENQNYNGDANKDPPPPVKRQPLAQHRTLQEGANGNEEERPGTESQMIYLIFNKKECVCY